MMRWNALSRAVLIRLKQDPILYASLFLAVLSAFFVPVSKEYLSYIDFRVLSLLLSLMLVVAGFKRSGAFSST